MVDQAFARKFLNGASPLGHTLTLALNGPTPDPPIEIVGVAADAVYRSLREPMLPTMYFPLAQHDHELAFLLVLASASLSVRSKLASPGLLTRSVATAINIPIEKPERPLFGGKTIESDVQTNEQLDRRIYLIVLDDLHTAPSNAPRARAALHRLIEQNFGRSDLAAVVFNQKYASAATEVLEETRDMIAATRGNVMI